MKTFFTTALLLIVLMFASAAFGQASTPKRIQFAPGKSSATVKGTTGRNGTTYVIRARSGQMLILDLKPVSKLGIKVELDGRFGEMVLLREEKGGFYSIGLEESGDYTIFIGSLDHRSVAFTLSVKIRKMTDI